MACVALVVAVSTTQLAAVYGLVLKQYPFANASRLVLLSEGNRDTGVTRLPLTESAFPIYKERLAGLVSLGYFIPPARAFPVTTTDGVPIAYARVSPDTMELLGIRPRLGRLFNSDESLYPSPDLALLSERYWKVRFAGRADVLGQTLDLLVAGTRRPHRVVGVMAEDVSFP